MKILYITLLTLPLHSPGHPALLLEVPPTEGSLFDGVLRNVVDPPSLEPEYEMEGYDRSCMTRWEYSAFRRSKERVAQTTRHVEEKLPWSKDGTTFAITGTLEEDEEEEEAASLREM